MAEDLALPTCLKAKLPRLHFGITTHSGPKNQECRVKMVGHSLAELSSPQDCGSFPASGVLPGPVLGTAGHAAVD